MTKKTLYTEEEKLYKKIKIYKKIYKIFICKILKVDNKKHLGCIDYDDRKIYLLKDKYLKETLIHELTHAFLNEINKKARLNKSLILRLRSNEYFIEELGYIIYKLFKLK